MKFTEFLTYRVTRNTDHPVHGLDENITALLQIISKCISHRAIKVLLTRILTKLTRRSLDKRILLHLLGSSRMINYFYNSRFERYYRRLCYLKKISTFYIVTPKTKNNLFGPTHNDSNIYIYILSFDRWNLMNLFCEIKIQVIK